jgi:hypothetical protein
VTADRLGKVQQVILLCALAVCVVAMHHVSLSHCMGDAASSTAASAFGPEMAGSAPGGGSGEQHPGMPDGLHDMLHLCLAVLYAAGLLLLALVACLGISWLNTAFPRSRRIHQGNTEKDLSCAKRPHRWHRPRRRRASRRL